MTSCVIYSDFIQCVLLCVRSMCVVYLTSVYSVSVCG